MSVIIKGMEIPDDCHACNFRDDTWCIAAQRYLQEYTVNCLKGIYCRETDCPFGEVPTPHGRLIDADALVTTIKEHDYRLHDILTDTTKPGMFTFGIEYAICNAPTIVEAEEQV